MFACDSILQRDGFEVVEVPGGRSIPADRPAEIVRAVAPDDAIGISLAEKLEPAPAARTDSPVYRATAGVESAFLRSGDTTLTPTWS